MVVRLRASMINAVASLWRLHRQLIAKYVNGRDKPAEA